MPRSSSRQPAAFSAGGRRGTAPHSDPVGTAGLECRPNQSSCRPGPVRRRPIRGGGAMSELPQTMPAAVLRRPGQVVVEQRPVPLPRPGEVLVEVDHCGICGSDVHMLLDGWGEQGLVAGHEFTGTIAALGDGVTGWELGETVVGGTSPRCGDCRRCLEGKPSQCENRQGPIVDGHDGAFARYVLVRAASCSACRPDSPRQAALAEPLAVALHGITRSGAAPGDTVMVIGAGPIGALSIAALVARGIGPVIAVEPGARRKQLARDLGADEVLDPTDLETFPPWEPERITDRATDVVLECSGKKAAMEAGFHQLGRGGTLVLVGAGIEHPAFDPNRFVLNELHVVGSFVYDLDGFERALELLGSDRFPTDLLIEAEDVPLDRLSEALSGLAEGRLAGKVMVVPHRPRVGTGPGPADGASLLPDWCPPFQPCGHEHARRPAGPRAPCRHLPVLGRGVRLRGDRGDDRGPPAPDPVVCALGPVHLPHRRGRADALPPDGPLRLLGGHTGRVGGRPGPGPAFRPGTIGWTSSTCTWTTRESSRSTRSTSGTFSP